MSITNDLLNIEKINSLTRPLSVMLSSGDTYDLESVCVETGLARIDVMGKLDNLHFSNFSKLIDADMNEYEPDDFYLD
tara:strand:- start:264 stop:497 length:234 start_codon:yes stop_codon:yes gene_type:complete